MQGQGVGSMLVVEGLARLRGRGAAGCVVLGEPHYYRRFGFGPDASLVLPDVPPASFMAQSWRGPVTGKIPSHPLLQSRRRCDVGGTRVLIRVTLCGQ